ncbi:hypothetical protein U9M48_008881 [Paspalum notatum var. saurae]|uniref:Uncharacterized protein n=1 Tax=Paspalum notatum var. saurae TaxID=547442 RepID=A0AAQ3WE83_PASNO
MSMRWTSGAQSFACPRRGRARSLVAARDPPSLRPLPVSPRVLAASFERPSGVAPEGGGHTSLGSRLQGPVAGRVDRWTPLITLL